WTWAWPNGVARCCSAAPRSRGWRLAQSRQWWSRADADPTPMPNRLGAALPSIATPPPGPASRALAQRLSAVESRNITAQTPDCPIFLHSARGANVRDVDGNIYIDLTAGFSVAATGHANAAVTKAAAAQMRTLAHALGDV